MNAPDRPNLLILMADQLRRQALGCYGCTDAVTPNIDALAAHGVRFTNACATCPICVPFRFSLMTGEYAHSRQVPSIEYRMSPAEQTLADEFNAAGYETAYFGKWHLAGGHGRPPYSGKEPCNLIPVPRGLQGRWQYWRGFELCVDYNDCHYFIDDEPITHRIEGYETDGLFDLGMEYLRTGRDASRPFCALISVDPPHPPYVAPPPSSY